MTKTTRSTISNPMDVYEETEFLRRENRDEQSLEMHALLEAINELAQRGFGTHFPMPKIIVRGDISSGKSSVLDAVSRISFPVNETRCTTFTTEVEVCKHPGSNTFVNILPSNLKALDERRQSFEGAQDIPKFIDLAKQMFSNAAGGTTNFICDNVLRFQIDSRDLPPTSFVGSARNIGTTPHRDRA